MMQPAPFSNVPTTDDIAQKRRMAQLLMQQGTDASPVGHWTQALARVVQGGVGGYQNQQANQGQQDRNSAVMQALTQSGTLQGLGDGDRAMLAQDPELMRGVASRAMINKITPKDTSTSGMREYQAAVSQGFKGTFLDYKRALAEAGRPTTNVTVSTDREGAKVLAKRQGERVEAGDQARKMKSDLAVMEDLSNRIGTVGASGEIKRVIGPYATALGIQIEGLSDIEAFSSVVSRIAPTMRPPGSGATSDFEFKQFLNALPKLSQTAEGRKLILQQLNALSDYNIAVADIAEQQLAGEIDRPTARQMIQKLGNPFKMARQSQPQRAAPPEAVDMLRQNPTPQMKAQFDQIFGTGAADRALGGR